MVPLMHMRKGTGEHAQVCVLSCQTLQVSQRNIEKSTNCLELFERGSQRRFLGMLSMFIRRAVRYFGCEGCRQEYTMGRRWQ